MRLLTVALPLLLLSCSHGSDSSSDSDPSDSEPDASGGPIVVVFTADTLGLVAAHQTDWCGHLRTILGTYGLDMACLDGAIAPSSWTGESHTRVLWPQHLDGDIRANEAPECGKKSVLATVADDIGGRYLFGSDNSVLSSRGKPLCPDGSTPFSQNTDQYDETFEELQGLADVPEAQRPVHYTIDSLVLDIVAQRPVVSFLNAFEVGGHQPRCFFDPYTEACEALWAIAVEENLVTETDDRPAAWLDANFNAQLLGKLSNQWATREAELRPIMWQSMLEAIVWHRPALFDDRITRILDAAQTAGRLDDVEILVIADHGENPCVARGFDGTLNCAHAGMTTEWTGLVPVFVSPASRADAWRAAGLVGDASHPWSLTNVAWGLLNDRGMATPPDWPARMPLGTASSWTCRTFGDEAALYSGLRVEGNLSVRCEDGQCLGNTWTIPNDTAYDPISIPFAELPDTLEAWRGPPDWFHDACGEE